MKIVEESRVFKAAPPRNAILLNGYAVESWQLATRYSKAAQTWAISLSVR